MDRAVVPTVVVSALSIPLLGPNGAAGILNALPFLSVIISTSLNILNFVSAAAERGILIKDGRTLELLSSVDTLVFDKTGTLTLSQPHVGSIQPCPGYTADAVLTYAAAAERRHSHPIALAIVQAAQARNLPLPPLDAAHYQLGYGITVTIDGSHIRVGSVRFMHQEQIPIPPAIQRTIEAAYQRGVSVVLVAVNTDLAGVLELHATVRPEVRQVIDALRQRKLSLHILSGDHPQPTQQLAADLGIEHYGAEVLPDDKAQFIAALQAAGKSVCFVGDGINDTLAMKEAAVSVSLRGATTAATDAAHVVLMHQDLRQLLTLFEIERACRINTRNTMLAILGPASISVTGALFFGTGLAFTEYINQTAFPVSVATAMLPRWWYRPKEANQAGK